MRWKKSSRSPRKVETHRHNNHSNLKGSNWSSLHPLSYEENLTKLSLALAFCIACMTQLIDKSAEPFNKWRVCDTTAATRDRPAISVIRNKPGNAFNTSQMVHENHLRSLGGAVLLRLRPLGNGLLGGDEGWTAQKNSLAFILEFKMESVRVESSHISCAYMAHDQLAPPGKLLGEINLRNVLLKKVARTRAK